MFNVGQKVVFVGVKWSLRKWCEMLRHPYPGEMPIKGRIYTIENITPIGCLELVGVQSPSDGYWAAGFSPRVFRPIVERKTDIGFAHEILRKATRPAKIPALVLPDRNPA
jgi:hypothetical protein